MTFLAPLRRCFAASAAGTRLTIRRKILLALLAMSGITAVLGVYAVHGVRLSGDLVVETFDQALMSIDYARAAATDFAAMEAVLARRRLDAADPVRVAALDARQGELADTIADDLAIAGERAVSVRAAGAARAVSQAVSKWLAGRTALLAGAPTLLAWRELDRQQEEVDSRIDLLINLVAGDGFRHRERAIAETRAAQRVTLLLLLGALALSGGIAALLARQIMGPVRAASAAASAIAAGELATAIPRAGRDELGCLLQAMTVMRDAIRTMVEREVEQRRSAQGRLADALESSREGFMLVDRAGRLAIANSRLAEFLPALSGLMVPGTPFGQLVGAAIGRRLFVAPDAAARRGLRDRLARPSPAPVEARPVEVRLADGRWLLISRSAAQDGGTMSVWSDISAIRQREQDLRQSNLCLDAALNSMVQGLCLFGPDGRLRVANRRYGEIFQIDPEVLRAGAELRDLLAASLQANNYGDMTLATLEAELLAAIERGPGRYVREIGGGRVVEVTHAPLAEGGWVATFEDVTERRRSQETISFLARHDQLTRLPNRVRFHEAMEEEAAALGHGAGGAALCLNLDHFKAVNDTLGHAAGDRLLCEVAERLQSCVPAGDLVARLGGDEFAIMQAGLERPEQAAELAQLVVDALARPFELDGQQVGLAASIGIALAPGDGELGETLLNNAASALSRAKRERRGSYRSFDPEMDARLQARRAMELDLRRALAADEFELFYQPLVDVSARRVASFESLLRWRHPKTGMVSPAEFIPLAEETGLIVGIGEWVLRTACKEAALWPDSVKVAVNVSPLQFADRRLVDIVSEALAKSGLSPHRLELEITESVLLQDDAAMLAVLHRIRALGVRISMDDFGTGYSSLNYLLSFPFDKIKIDQSFVRNLAKSADATTIVGAMAGLGRSLGMRTVAEGVETEEQLAQLRAAGCTEVQGYLFSKPRPAREVAALIVRVNAQAAPKAATCSSVDLTPVPKETELA